VVEIAGLKKRFGSIRALDGISLAIKPGEITAVVGPNAAGKSTLLRCIVGLVYPDAGEIRIDGLSINGDWRCRRRLGYVAQTAHFPESLSVRELFAFIRDIRGADSGDGKELIGLFGLEGALDRPVRQLSGGTRQKISIVLATMFDPEILIMDEPTAGLDPLSSQRQKKWLERERARGKTILVASHIIAEVEELSDRVIFLLDGKVYFDGAPGEAARLTGERTLERAIAAMMEQRSSCGR
jgi:Cu-processing system ATP-binding protein